MSAPTQEEVNNLIHAKERAENAIAFADSVKMDVQNIEGTRYKFRFNEAWEGDGN